MIGSVILWLFYTSSGTAVLAQERFTSLAACEAFVTQWRHSDRDDRSHTCFEDF